MEGAPVLPGCNGHGGKHRGNPNEKQLKSCISFGKVRLAYNHG